VASIEAKVDPKRKPGLQAQVHEPQNRMLIIKVVMEAFARLQAQFQELSIPVALDEISQAGFDTTPDANETALDGVTAGEITSQGLLALGTGLQIDQRPSILLGQLMSGQADPISPMSDEGREVFEQNTDFAQIAEHHFRLIEESQAGLQANAVKASKNTDDRLRVLGYKRGRNVVDGGGMFFHTLVLPQSTTFCL
jgi:hypothetical protein